MMKLEKPQIAALACAAVLLAVITNRFMALAHMKAGMQAGADFAAKNLLNLNVLPAPATDALSLSLTLLAVVIVFALAANAAAKGTFRRGEEHGSARWATMKEMNAFADRKNPVDNTILSQDVRLRYRRGDDFMVERNRNVLVIGGSGSGKTRGYVKPNLMQVVCDEMAGEDKDQERFARSFFVTDPKGTTRAETGHLFAEKGYVIKELNLLEFEASMHYNPLKYIDSEEDVMTFATCLIANTTPPNANNAGDPFWENSEKLVYQALINYVLRELPEEDRNLVSVCKLLDLGQHTGTGMSGLDILFWELETGKEYIPPRGSARYASGASMKRDVKRQADVWRQVRDPQPDHPAVIAYNSFKSGAPETIQSILISCKVRLARLRPPRVANLLKDDEMELDRFGDKKMILYAIVSDQDPTYNFLLALMMWQMIKQLSDRALTKYGGALPIGVDLLMDEAANFYIPDLQKTVAVCRSRNIGLTIILQSNAQLESRYHDDAPTIVDNCDTLVFLGGKSQKTNKELEDIMGQQTITTDNTSQSHAQQSSWSKQIAQHGRALLQSSEIAKMPRDECLVLITGNNPYKGPKFDVTKHPMYGYLDAGHKGALFDRPFDFAAYKVNPRYYDAEAELTFKLTKELTRGRCFSAERVPKDFLDMRWVLEVGNASDVIAYNIRGEVEVGRSCPTNDESRSGGRGIAVQAVEPYNTRDGACWQRAITRVGGIRQDPDTPCIEFNANKGRFELHGLDLPARTSITHAISYRLDLGCVADAAAELAEHEQSGSGATEVDMRFKYACDIMCANAEGFSADDVSDVTVGADGVARLEGETARPSSMEDAAAPAPATPMEEGPARIRTCVICGAHEPADVGKPLDDGRFLCRDCAMEMERV